MVILLLSILIVALIVSRNEHFDKSDKICLTALFGAVLYFAISLITFIPSRTWYERSSSVNIIATKTDQRIEGEFSHGIFYSRMRVEDKDYYFVMTNRNGSYKSERCLVENTIIKEIDGTPYLKRTKKYVTSSWPMWLRFKEVNGTLVGEKDTIFVPRGTMSNINTFDVF